MNHEIRTPLNAVIGNLELLALTQLDSGQHELARMAKISADILLQLIGDLLDLSKIQADRLDLEAIDTDVWQLIDEVLTIIGPRAQQKGLRVAARIAADVPKIIKTDPLRLRQVLVNFVGNAVKFTDTGGVFITVRTMGGSAGVELLHLEVVDTGPGFDPARAAELFRPFIQEDASTTRRFGGTGLGLSISQGIIRQMGGEVGCSAERGQGASFWCSLPIASTIEAERVDLTDLSGRTVLVVGSGDGRSAIADRLVGHGAAVLARDSTQDLAQDLTQEPAVPAPDVLSLVVAAAAPGDEAHLLERLPLLTAYKVPIVVAVSEVSNAFRYRAHRAGADYLIRIPEEAAT